MRVASEEIADEVSLRPELPWGLRSGKEDVSWRTARSGTPMSRFRVKAVTHSDGLDVNTNTSHLVVHDLRRAEQQISVRRPKISRLIMVAFVSSVCPRRP